MTHDSLVFVVRGRETSGSIHDFFLRSCWLFGEISPFFIYFYFLLRGSSCMCLRNFIGHNRLIANIWLVPTDYFILILCFCHSKDSYLPMSHILFKYQLYFPMFETLFKIIYTYLWIFWYVRRCTLICGSIPNSSIEFMKANISTCPLEYFRISLSWFLIMFLSITFLLNPTIS